VGHVCKQQRICATPHLYKWDITACPRKSLKFKLFEENVFWIGFVNSNYIVCCDHVYVAMGESGYSISRVDIRVLKCGVSRSWIQYARGGVAWLKPRWFISRWMCILWNCVASYFRLCVHREQQQDQNAYVPLPFVHK